MADLLQEFMEDVRADRIQDLWKRYGKWVIYAAVSVVLITAGFSYKDHRKRVVAMEQTGLYLEAGKLLDAGDAEAALGILQRLEATAEVDYRGLVALKKLQALQALGKTKELHEAFESLATRSDLYGDVARVLQKQAMASGGNAAAALPYTRQEWAAWGLLERKEYAKAKAAFASLAKEKDIPETMRERVHMMAQYSNMLGASQP